MSLLSRLPVGARPAQLTCLISPCVRAAVPIRYSSKKKTLEKYGAKAAKSGRHKGDFLSNFKQDDKKKSKGAAAAAEQTEVKVQEVKDDKTITPAQMALLEDNSTNVLFGYPNLTIAEQRYDEYEKGESEYRMLEPVSEEQLNTEREEQIQRLWEPYETETFNLKALIGDATAKDPTSPQEIIEERPSKMYYYTDEEIARYLPEGTAGKLKEFQRKGFNKKGILVRPAVEDLISWMEEWRTKKFIGRRREKDFYTLLSGPSGSGKSCLLNPIVHWARLSGWLVLFVPDGKDWAGYPKRKEGLMKKLSLSEINKTWFGQPHMAKRWIKALLDIHADKLATLPLRTSFTVRDKDPDKPQFVSSPERTIKDLLEYGISQPTQASDCIWYMRKELCSVTEYPILIVVDAVNALRHHSWYGDPIDPYVFSPNLDTSRLVVANAFRDFRNHGLINGLYIGTITNSTSRRPLQEKMPNPDMKKTQYRLKSNLAITQVPALSRADCHKLGGYYRENGVLTEDVPSQTIDYMWVMSEGNGHEFWRQAEFM